MLQRKDSSLRVTPIDWLNEVEFLTLFLDIFSFLRLKNWQQHVSTKSRPDASVTGRSEEAKGPRRVFDFFQVSCVGKPECIFFLYL